MLPIKKSQKIGMILIVLFLANYVDSHICNPASYGAGIYKYPKIDFKSACGVNEGTVI